MKMFYLVDYLKRNTDMDHTVSMKEILEYLDSNGISAERKSIYNDIELLNNYGYDINFKKNNKFNNKIFYLKYKTYYVSLILHLLS